MSLNDSVFKNASNIIFGKRRRMSRRLEETRKMTLNREATPFGFAGKDNLRVTIMRRVWCPCKAKHACCHPNRSGAYGEESLCPGNGVMKIMNSIIY
jgi:hypothetical protein